MIKTKKKKNKSIIIFNVILVLFVFSIKTLQSQTLTEKREGSLVGLQDSLGNIVVPVIYDQIIDPYDQAIAVQKENKWGILSRDNKVIQPFIYKSMMYGMGYFIVRQGEKGGLLNRFGKNVVPFEYLYIKPYSSKSKYFIVTDFNKKYGVIDIDNNQVIDFKYDRLEFITDTTFAAKDSVSSKYGVIDLNEKLILPYEFSSIEPGIDINNYIVSHDSFKYGLVDNNGNFILPITHDEIKVFKTEYYRVEDDDWQGIADHTGKMIIPLEYKRISDLRHSLFAVSNDNIHYGYVDNNNKYIIKPEFSLVGLTTAELWTLQNPDTEEWYLYDPSTEKILPQSYESYDYSFDTELLILQKDSLFGIVDLNLKEILPFEYNYLEFGKGESIIAKKNNKWGFIDSTGKILIPFKYTDMTSLSDQTRAFQENKKWNIFDLTGKQFTDVGFDEINKIKVQGHALPYYFIVGKDNRFGIIDRYGDVIRNLEYDTIRVNSILDFELRKDGKWGLSSMSLFRKGQLYDITPCIYDSLIFDKHDNTYILEKDRKWGKFNLSISDPKKEEIIPMIYDSFQVYKSDHTYQVFYIVSLNNKYGIITKEKTLLDCIYDEIDLDNSKYENNYVSPSITLKVRKGNEWNEIKVDLK